MQMQIKKKHVLLGGIALLILGTVIAFTYPMATSFIGSAFLVCIGIASIVKSLAENPSKYPLMKVDQRKAGLVVVVIGVSISLTFCSLFGAESKTTGQENFVYAALALIGFCIVAVGFYIASKVKASDEWD